MFFEFIALIVLCGSNGVIGNEHDEVPLVKADPPESNLFCEVCTSTMNASKYMLDTRDLLPYVYKYLDQICDLFPKNYQAKVEIQHFLKCSMTKVKNYLTLTELEELLFHLSTYFNLCHELVHGGLVEKLHHWIDQINIYKFCSKIGFCNSTKSSSASSVELSRINEHMEYASTYLMNPNYVETASEELCRTYAEDFNGCKDTLMMLANIFIEMQRQLLDVF